MNRGPETSLFAHCRGIVFDLDDTLYDRHSALARLFERWWGPLSAADWEEIDREDARGHSPRVPFFTFLKSRFPVPDATPELLWARYQREFPQYIQADETQAVLGRLTQTPLSLSILTNGSLGFQRAKYLAARLELFIGTDRLFVSGEIGRDKPDPLTFRHASSAMGLEPEELLFVGDHPEKDIAGARTLGFSTCWLQKSTGERAEADATLQTLTELLPLLGIPQ